MDHQHHWVSLYGNLECLCKNSWQLWVYYSVWTEVLDWLRDLHCIPRAIMQFYSMIWRQVAGSDCAERSLDCISRERQDTQSGANKIWRGGKWVVGVPACLSFTILWLVGAGCLGGRSVTGLLVCCHRQVWQRGIDEDLQQEGCWKLQQEEEQMRSRRRGGRELEMWWQIK